MEKQGHLLLGHAPITGERKEPRLWIKEFGFFTDFKKDAELRHVSFRQGMNIIWAKESTEGASGHAAGKSTFCRMIRYLMADHSYGSEDFRSSLLTAFPEGLLIGEILLNGQSWLLCRSLLNTGNDWAVRGGTYENAFDDGLKKSPYKDFVTALHQAFIVPLGVTHFPGTEKELEWQHLLPWLTRDQDARYAEALVWRGIGETHTTLKNEKINLIRLVLRLLDSDELAQQCVHSELLAKKKRLRTEIPQLSFARDRRLKDLYAQFPILKNSASSDLEIELEVQEKESEALLLKISGSLKTSEETDGLDDVLRASVEAKTFTRDSLLREFTACDTAIKRYQSRLAYRQGKLSKEEFKKQQSELSPVVGMCSESIEDALAAGCPLAPAANRDELTAQRYKDAQEDVEELEQAIARQKIKKARLDQELATAKRILEPLVNKSVELKTAHAEKIKGLRKAVVELSVCHENLKATLKDTRDLQTKKAEQEQVDKEIEDSNTLLRDLRIKSVKLLSELTNDFNVVASHLTKTEIHGKIEFESDSLKATMNYAGDETSAALITLRLLAFDLAALLGSVRTNSHHPGFLLHDSPREADLSSHIYRRIFTLIAGTVSEQDNQAIQYIIATTEPPPEHLQKEPWLVCPPLSSEKPDDRFLKAII
jgi:hypothetical protein